MIMFIFSFGTKNQCASRFTQLSWFAMLLHFWHLERKKEKKDERARKKGMPLSWWHPNDSENGHYLPNTFWRFGEIKCGIIAENFF